MANHLVNGGAYTLWIAFIIQWGRDPAMADGLFMYPVIDLLGSNAWTDVLSHIIQHGNIDLTTFFDLLNLLRGFDQVVVKYRIAFLLHLFQLFVKCFVALFVFFAASAPAGIISSYF